MSSFSPANWQTMRACQRWTSKASRLPIRTIFRCRSANSSSTRKKSFPGGNKASLDDNLIIHGDNLEALKALLPRYAGKVDVIYIDPPYNTGNEGWAYNDNVNSPLMKEWLHKVVDKDDLERHDKWLCMMWPRLQLLCELLSEDGSIWVSCNDIEGARLKVVMDEIFGEQNFVCFCIWQKRFSRPTTIPTFPKRTTTWRYTQRRSQDGPVTYCRAQPSKTLCTQIRIAISGVIGLPTTTFQTSQKRSERIVGFQLLDRQTGKRFGRRRPQCGAILSNSMNETSRREESGGAKTA